MCSVTQTTTGRTYTLREEEPSMASEISDPVDMAGPFPVSELPGTMTGSIFVYWIGDRRCDAPEVITAIERHLNDHDVVGVRILRALPESCHPSIRDRCPLAIKPRLGETSEAVWRAFQHASERGVVVPYRGLLYAEAADLAGNHYSWRQGKMYTFARESVGMTEKVTPDRSQDAFHRDLDQDQIRIVVRTRPGFMSEYGEPRTVMVLHEPLGKAFA